MTSSSRPWPGSSNAAVPEVANAIRLLFEGFEAAVLPCSLVLFVPGAAAALAARQESTPALLGYGSALAAMSWLRFSNSVSEPDQIVVGMGFAAACALLIVPLIRRLDVVSAAGGAVAGAATSMLWLPCVGPQFSAILPGVFAGGAKSVIMMSIYFVGLLAPLLALGSILQLIPDLAELPIRFPMMIIGGGTLAVMALATMAGLHEELLSQLLEWSRQT